MGWCAHNATPKHKAYTGSLPAPLRALLRLLTLRHVMHRSALRTRMLFMWSAPMQTAATALRMRRPSTAAPRMASRSTVALLSRCALNLCLSLLRRVG